MRIAAVIRARMTTVMRIRAVTRQKGKIQPDALNTRFRV
jgi:hypothetical protein